jgi:hypothetical protein
MHTYIGMAGKITDEMIFDAERRSKLSETIVGAMTEEERSNPDLIVATVPMMDDAYMFIYTGSSTHNAMLCYVPRGARRSWFRMLRGGRGSWLIVVEPQSKRCVDSH